MTPDLHEALETLSEVLHKLDDDGACMCFQEGNTAGYECAHHLSRRGLAASAQIELRLDWMERQIAGLRCPECVSPEYCGVTIAPVCRLYAVLFG